MESEGSTGCFDRYSCFHPDTLRSKQNKLDGTVIMYQPCINPPFGGRLAMYFEYWGTSKSDGFSGSFMVGQLEPTLKCFQAARLAAGRFFQAPRPRFTVLVGSEPVFFWSKNPTECRVERGNFVFFCLELVCLNYLNFDIIYIYNMYYIY